MIPGNGEIVQTIFDANGNLSLTLKMNDYGVLNTLIGSSSKYMTFTARLYYFDETNGKWKESTYLRNNYPTLDDNLYSLNTDALKNKGDSVKIKIKCKTRLWPLGKNSPYDDKDKHAVSFTYELGEMVITRGNPTFSYRKNRIGVNYNFPSTESDANINEAVLVINKTEIYDKIVFKGDSNSIVFDLSAGTMSGLNIEIGEIDGGTW